MGPRLGKHRDMRIAVEARLVDVIVLVDGAVVRCSSCTASVPLPLDDVLNTVVRFQDEHFACDPHLRLHD